MWNYQVLNTAIAIFKTIETKDDLTAFSRRLRRPLREFQQLHGCESRALDASTTDGRLASFFAVLDLLNSMMDF